MSDLPNIDRKKLLDLLHEMKEQNRPGCRGRRMEAFCSSKIDVLDMITAEVIFGRLDV